MSIMVVFSWMLYESLMLCCIDYLVIIFLIGVVSVGIMSWRLVVDGELLWIVWKYNGIINMYCWVSVSKCVRYLGKMRIYSIWGYVGEYVG